MALPFSLTSIDAHFPLDELPIVLTTIASDGTYLYSLGAKGLRIFGLKPNERVGQNVFKAWSARPDVIAHLRKALYGETFTTTIEVAGRSLFHLFFPVKDAIDTVTHLHVLVVDISDAARDESTPLERERRLRLQHESLVRLAKSDFIGKVDLTEAYQIVTELASRLLNVSRVGIWFFNETRTELHCANCYERDSKTHHNGEVFPTNWSPSYFKAIDEERVIAVSNLAEDPLTKGTFDTYTQKTGVRGLLDAPIRIDGKVTGILCHESTDENRVWSVDDKNFAGAVADLLSLSIERQARAKTNSRLSRRLKLEQLLTSLATSFLDLPPEYVNEAILRSLGTIGNFFQAQRCFLLVAEGRASESFFEWSPFVPSLRETILPQKNSIMESMVAGLSSPLLFNDIKNLNVKPSPKAMFPEDVKAAALIPLIEGGRLLGLMGIQRVEAPADWEEEIFSLLNIAGEMCINALNRKRLDEEMRMNLAILDMVQDAVMVTDLNGRMLFWNDGAASIYGFERKEMIGKSFCQSLGGFTDISRRALETDGVWSAELPHVTKEGKNITILARFRVMKAENGLPQSVLIIGTDITEKKLYEEQTQRNSKLETLGVLAGGIAHDFNNILTSISGAVSLSALKPQDAPIHLESARTALERAKDLTQQFLTFSKGGAPIRTICSLDKLIKETTSFALAGSRSTPKVDISKDLYPCYVDKGQISQVLQNLLLNADQAMPNGGEIKISSFNLSLPSPDCDIFNYLPAGNYVKVIVRDCGEGIPEEVRSKIFDPYFTTKRSGTGLGLATTYSIIRHHGGDITFISETGKGTEFRFVIPAASNVENNDITPENKNEKLHSTRSFKILILDDEPMIRDTLTQMLSHLGHEVDSVGSASEFVNIYSNSQSKSPYDLLIMDLTVPGDQSPQETLSQLKSINPNVSVIVSSGYSTDPLMAEHKKHGFAGVMRKPYSFEELKTCIETSIPPAYEKPQLLK